MMTPAVQDASCAAGVFLCRSSEAQPSGSYPPSKKEYFLIATTPQALACGVSAQLVQKPRGVSPPQRRKKVSIIFSGDMCGGENTARPANVRAVRLGGRRVRCSRPQPLCQKGILFDSDNPAGNCPRWSGSACLKASQSFAAAAAKESPIIFFGDMRGGENTARPANVRAVRQGGRRVRCSRPQILSSKKYYFFDKDNPAGNRLRGCLSTTLQAQRSAFLSWDAGELRLRQITPTARPSSRRRAS